MHVSPDSLSFSKQNSTEVKSVKVTGVNIVAWSAKATAGIVVAPPNGVNDDSFNVTIPGLSAGSITVTAPGHAPIMIPVSVV
jgi:hypothetical protein